MLIELILIFAFSLNFINAIENEYVSYAKNPFNERKIPENGYDNLFCNQIDAKEVYHTCYGIINNIYMVINLEEKNSNDECSIPINATQPRFNIKIRNIGFFVFLRDSNVTFIPKTKYEVSRHKIEYRTLKLTAVRDPIDFLQDENLNTKRLSEKMFDKFVHYNFKHPKIKEMFVAQYESIIGYIVKKIQYFIIIIALYILEIV